MSNDGYIYAAYGLTWAVLIVFTLTTLRRARRAERSARAIALSGEEL